MEIPTRDWQLTRRFQCPACGERYAVVEWKLDPKCRQCGTALRPEEDSHVKPSVGVGQGVRNPQYTR